MQSSAELFADCDELQDLQEDEAVVAVAESAGTEAGLPRDLDVEHDDDDDDDDDDDEVEVPPADGTTADGSHCPICLGQFSNRTVLPSCFHEFCHACILTWSQVSRACPLCKTVFTDCLHSFRGNNDFVRYEFPRMLAAGAQFASSSSAGRPSTSQHGTNGRRRTVAERLKRKRAIALDSETEEERQRRLWVDGRLRDGAEFRSLDEMDRRRFVYRHNLLAKHVGVNLLSGYRWTVTPESFRRDKNLRARFIPWLRRELRVLLRDDDIELIKDFVIAVMEKYGLDRAVSADSFVRFEIQSQASINLLRPYILEKTEHFVHEIVSFLRSPYDCDTWDRMVQYDEPRTVLDWIPERNHHAPAAARQDLDDGDSGRTVMSPVFLAVPDPAGDDQQPGSDRVDADSSSRSEVETRRLSRTQSRSRSRRRSSSRSRNYSRKRSRSRRRSVDRNHSRSQSPNHRHSRSESQRRGGSPEDEISRKSGRHRRRRRRHHHHRDDKGSCSPDNRTIRDCHRNASLGRSLSEQESSLDRRHYRKSPRRRSSHSRSLSPHRRGSAASFTANSSRRRRALRSRSRSTRMGESGRRDRHRSQRKMDSCGCDTSDQQGNPNPVNGLLGTVLRCEANLARKESVGFSIVGRGALLDEPSEASSTEARSSDVAGVATVANNDERVARLRELALASVRKRKEGVADEVAIADKRVKTDNVSVDPVEDRLKMLRMRLIESIKASRANATDA